MAKIPNFQLKYCINSQFLKGKKVAFHTTQEKKPRKKLKVSAKSKARFAENVPQKSLVYIHITLT